MGGGCGDDEIRDGRTSVYPTESFRDGYWRSVRPCVCSSAPALICGCDEMYVGFGSPATTFGQVHPDVTWVLYLFYIIVLMTVI